MKFISKVIEFLSYTFPKFNWAIIQTYPTWEGSGVVLYQALMDTKIKKIIWLVPDIPSKKIIQIDDKKTFFVKRRSLKGVIYFLFSKFVFITHGLYTRGFSKRQISVNMWHGMPIKKIGLLDGNLGLKTTYTLSTGKYFQELLADSFGVNQASILNIGLLRNEELIKGDWDVRSKLEIPSECQLLIWLPTYRKSNEGDIRIDGKDFDNPFQLGDFDIKNFNSFLKELNVICYFKPHPMAEVEKFENLTSLKMINDQFLDKKCLTLYRVLSSSDFLITDISSVVIDYLLLNKPIIFSFADKEEYLRSRGLNFTDIIENPPGPICNTTEEIKKAIKLFVSGKDIYNEKRELYRARYHNNIKPTESTSRLLKVLGLD